MVSKLRTHDRFSFSVRMKRSAMPLPLRDAVTTTVSPKLASCSSTGGSSSAAPPTVTSSTVASENPANDTVSV